ncbi:CubicO group peptidase, beta-lactamase class C family [Pseudomonas flavescens]|uniref:CubicO group peptidase, beta-lactamase class C family n=2 Tax=Phytopseudomonas flavescens TaxID=29435 RepID=A0A1G8J101_9GAMM|nr:CubicO group peptidase, beta-lactamase class C family [Pseudomonas flavescens]
MSDVSDHRPGPGSVSLLCFEQGGCYERSVGVEKLIDSKPIGSDTVFDLASVSKQFTAFCLLLLERDGILSLEDPLCRFVPELSSCAGDVVLRDLIYHISGIPDFVDIALSRGIKFDDPLSAEHILGLLEEQAELQFSTGSRFEYSNSGYFLLGLVISRASGISFSDYAREHIFEPLLMRDSFILDGMSEDGRVATGYAKDENGDYVVSRNPWNCIGASLVHSSASDLMKWGHNFFHAKVGGAAIIEKMLTPLSPNNNRGQPIADYSAYCFGLCREEGASGVKFCHDGGTAGFSTHFACSIEEGYTVAVLSNIEDHDAERLADEICSAHCSLRA